MWPYPVMEVLPLTASHHCLGLNLVGGGGALQKLPVTGFGGVFLV